MLSEFSPVMRRLRSGATRLPSPLDSGIAAAAVLGEAHSAFSNPGGRQSQPPSKLTAIILVFPQPLIRPSTNSIQMIMVV